MERDFELEYSWMVDFSRINERSISSYSLTCDVLPGCVAHVIKLFGGFRYNKVNVISLIERQVLSLSAGSHFQALEYTIRGCFTWFLSRKINMPSLFKVLI